MAQQYAAACRELCEALATLQSTPIKAPAGTPPNVYEGAAP
jgi:hypothetical protein